MKTTIGELKKLLKEALETKVVLITLEQAQSEFPDAISALDVEDMGLSELKFWKDYRGYLHCDDRVHPSFDDMWDPNVSEWVGSDIDYPDMDFQ